MNLEDPLEEGKTAHSSIWPGEFHGLYSPWGRKESDTTERLSHNNIRKESSQVLPHCIEFLCPGTVKRPDKEAMVLAEKNYCRGQARKTGSKAQTCLPNSKARLFPNPHLAARCSECSSLERGQRW